MNRTADQFIIQSLIEIQIRVGLRLAIGPGASLHTLARVRAGDTAAAAAAASVSSLEGRVQI